MDHAARAKEQQRFEESMGHEVKDSGGEGAHTEGEKHVAELADGRISEDFLDVVLHERHGRRENGGDRADHCHGIHCKRGELVNGVHAGNHVDTGGHHGGSVDQRAYWRRAFHGVG